MHRELEMIRNLPPIEFRVAKEMDLNSKLEEYLSREKELRKKKEKKKGVNPLMVHRHFTLRGHIG